MLSGCRDAHIAAIISGILTTKLFFSKRESLGNNIRGFFFTHYIPFGINNAKYDYNFAHFGNEKNHFVQ